MVHSPTALRRRKKTNAGSKSSSKVGDQPKLDPSGNRPALPPSQIYSVASLVCCILVAVASGAFLAYYAHMSQENFLWFSKLQEVEREISMRTERGLYYSYYKQLVHAPSIAQGLGELIRDPVTEHSHTINVLHRFNVYQEVILALTYRLTPLKDFVQPIFYYTDAAFAFGGLGLATLCCLTYSLSGSLLASLLCSAFFMSHLMYTTRLDSFANLRENFALPVFWMQNLFMCIFIRGDGTTRWRSGCLRCALLLSTFFFSIFWQFNQFLLLLQALVLYFLAVLRLIALRKVLFVYVVYVVTILALYVVQFGQSMILGSMVASFTPTAMVSLLLFRHWTHSGGIVTGFLKTAVQVIFTVLLSALAKLGLRTLLQLEADDHIYKFLFSRLGFSSARDFESRLYLCHAGFSFLSNDFFMDTTKSTLFPLYMAMLVGCFFVIGKDLLMKWCDLNMLTGERKAASKYSYEFFQRRVDLAFLVFQSALCGLLCMMASRMVYVWMPQMCVLASCALGDTDLWKSVVGLTKFRRYVNVKFVQAMLLLAAIAYNVVLFYPEYRETMDELREFYDPDTVDLMYWIGNSTAPHACFAGSMQLLAGVKCCTGRHITNHPHFEDKRLRDRTKEIYQIYGRRTAEEVYHLLKKYDTHYVILEDSICYETPKQGCSLTEIIDLENGHVPEGSEGPPLPGLTRSRVPRFCRSIMETGGSFDRFFRIMFKNKTFKVYQLL
uniref:C-mannosyltransferase DPY19L3 n=1 Tax=Trichuris muris TaxID=70415 RepID=A0A5S6QRL6_TRIMR